MQFDLNIRSRVGVVVIGRNEGERLKLCLTSLTNQTNFVVYVDSGSTDNSLASASALGAEVVNLDLNIPFTAARARNEGFQRLIEVSGEIEYVQFVDGDCEVVSTWLADAVNFLDANHQYAVVCGRRRERYPEHSIFNLMCDAEWDTPIGDAKACGGDALMRVKVFLEVGGYRNQLIAGEEPELCVRLRKNGWKIWRLGSEMTLHDAAITKFSQWWKRNVRSGYAFAEGAYLHGEPPERHWVKESRRSLIWGLAIPMLGIMLILIFGPLGMLFFILYFLQTMRLGLRYKKLGYLSPWANAIFLVISKFPEMVGQIRYWFSRILRLSAKLIEYK